MLKEVRGSDLIEQCAACRLPASRCSTRWSRQESSNDSATRLDDALTASLTPQESAILGHLADGLTNRQIAEQMFLAEKTVKNYVSNLLTQTRDEPPHAGRCLRRPPRRTTSPRALAFEQRSRAQSHTRTGLRSSATGHAPSLR